MEARIIDFIDFEKLNSLLEGFNKSTGFVTAILDLDGNILSKSGWRQICTEFHRTHPETAKRCLISDTVLANKMSEGEKYHFYQCLNGLVDVAVPIVIKGEHIANLFSGQFFFEEPDNSFFQKQADKFRFNRDIYLKALGKVPVISEEKVKVAMDFLLNMTQMISEITFQKLEQMELNEAIQKSERTLKLFVEHSPASIAMFDNNMCYLVASKRFLSDYNIGNQEITGRSHYEVFPEITERWKAYHRRGLAGETLKEDNDPFPRADGKTDWVRWEIRPWYETENQVGGIILFSEVITTQIEAREALRESEKYNRMLFEQSAIGLALTSFDGRLVDINSKFSDIIGRTVEEAKALTYWEITPEKYQKQEQQQLDSLAKTRRYGPYEKEYIHKDGHLIPVRLQGLVIERNNEKYIWSSVEDISIRKKAEIRLLESEKRYRYLFENNPLPMWIYDLQSLKFLEVNEVAILHYGYSKEEFLSMTIKDIRPEEDISDLEKDIAETHQLYYRAGVWRHKKKNGDLIFVEIISHQIEYENFTARLVLSNDVTEKIRSEQLLHETNEYLENLFNYANAPIIVWDNSYLITRFNRAFEKLSGYDTSEVLGKKIDFLFPKEKIQSSLHLIEKTTSGERWETIEIEILRKDQTIRTVLWNSANILDSTGDQIIATIAQGQDITERKQAGEELERFFNLVPTLVCIASMDGYFKKINDVWETTLGFTRAELLGEPFENFIHPDDIEPTRMEVARQIGGNSTINFTNRYRTKSGAYRWLEWYATPAINGETLYAAALDISERKLAEEKAKDQLDELRRWHDVTLDREYRIIELKQEVNELLLEKGQSARYGLSTDDFDEPMNKNINE